MSIKKKNDFEVFETHLEDDFQFGGMQSNNTNSQKKYKPISSNKNNKFKFLFPILIILISIPILFLLFNKLGTTQNKIIEENLNTDTTTEISNKKNIRPELQEARELYENDEIIAFLEFSVFSSFIPQGVDNVFYKTHNLNKSVNSLGCSYLNFDSTFEDKNILVYSNGIDKIIKYLDQEYFLKNDLIYTKDELYDCTWEIFSFYESNPEFNIIQTKFNDDDSFYVSTVNYLHKSLHSSDFTEADFSNEDQILTLVCDYGTTQYTLHAKLIEKKEFEN